MVRREGKQSCNIREFFVAATILLERSRKFEKISRRERRKIHKCAYVDDDNVKCMLVCECDVTGEKLRP
jgi:hypothetical protein